MPDHEDYVTHRSNVARRASEPYHARDMAPRTIAGADAQLRPKEPGYVEHTANQINFQRDQLGRVYERLGTLIDRINGNPTGKDSAQMPTISASIQETIRGQQENSELIDSILSRVVTLESML